MRLATKTSQHEAEEWRIDIAKLFNKLGIPVTGMRRCQFDEGWYTDNKGKEIETLEIKIVRNVKGNRK